MKTKIIYLFLAISCIANSQTSKKIVKTKINERLLNYFGKASFFDIDGNLNIDNEGYNLVGLSKSSKNIDIKKIEKKIPKKYKKAKSLGIKLSSPFYTKILKTTNKSRKDKSTKIAVYRYNYKNKNASTIEIVLQKNEIEFYVLKIGDNSFKLIGVSYDSFLKRDSHPAIQNTIILEYDFKGDLLNEKVLKSEIDNVNYEYAPLNNYSMDFKATTNLNNPSDSSIWYNDLAKSHIYNSNDTSIFFKYFFLKSRNSKHTNKVVIQKFDNDKLIWSKDLFLDKSFKHKVSSQRRIKGSYFNFNIIDDIVVLNVANIIDGSFLIFHINNISGDLLSTLPIKVELSSVYGSITGLNMYSKEVFGSNITMDVNSINAFYYNKDFNKYISDFIKYKTKNNFYSFYKNGVLKTARYNPKNKNQIEYVEF